MTKIDVPAVRVKTYFTGYSESQLVDFFKALMEADTKVAPRAFILNHSLLRDVYLYYSGSNPIHALAFQRMWIDLMMEMSWTLCGIVDAAEKG